MIYKIMKMYKYYLLNRTRLDKRTLSAFHKQVESFWIWQPRLLHSKMSFKFKKRLKFSKKNDCVCKILYIFSI